jgi:hypothetical protein
VCVRMFVRVLARVLLYSKTVGLRGGAGSTESHGQGTNESDKELPAMSTLLRTVPEA